MPSIGDIWFSPDTGNRWEIVWVSGPNVGVRRINGSAWDEEHVYTWRVECFGPMFREPSEVMGGVS